jgi:hypothetical protein
VARAATVVIPGAVAQCTGGRVVAPAFANFFRPNAPNYFLTQSILNLYNATPAYLLHYNERLPILTLLWQVHCVSLERFRRSVRSTRRFPTEIQNTTR